MTAAPIGRYSARSRRRLPEWPRTPLSQPLYQPIALPTAPSATGLYMPIHPSSKRTISIDNLPYSSAFIAFFSNGLKCLLLLPGRLQLKNSIRLRRRTSTTPLKIPMAEVDAVADEQDQQAEQHPHTSRREGGRGQAVESLPRNT